MTENKVVIADDHPMFLDGLQNAIMRQNRDIFIETADSYLNLFSVLDHFDEDIDLLIMDFHMPGGQGETGIFHIRQRLPDLPIIVLSAYDTIDIRIKCLEAGASDFVSKSTNVEDLVGIITNILDGTYVYPNQLKKEASQSLSANKISTLTPSQFKVLHLIANGYANKQIAVQLNISEKTVKNHITAIFEKLNVTNRTQASNIFNQQS